MKHAFCTLALLAAAHITFAQVPQGIPYQAVARNSSGTVLASATISVRFSIHDAAADGSVVYAETHNVTTSAQGLFTVHIGQGTPESGVFSDINWGVNAKFLQVEMDPAGGSSYADIGTQQMMSVPYALYAGKAGGVNGWTNNEGQLHNTDTTGRVGIGTSTPKARLHVADSSVVFTGSDVPWWYLVPDSEYANPPVSGAGSRMMWYADKMAFRSGLVVGEEWNKGNVGLHSFASGMNVKASGLTSAVIGGNSVASGLGSIALGMNSTASGDESVAIMGGSANGPGSIAAGYNSSASSFYSLAMGPYANASGVQSIALGGDVGPAMGATATGESSIAIGRYASATGMYAIAFGGSFATNIWSIALHGSAYGSHSTAIRGVATGELSLSLHGSATNDYATAIGWGASATGFGAVAVGQSSSSGYFSFASNWGNSSGEYSTAMGFNAQASGNSSTAMGLYANASGHYSTALGIYTTASGQFSTATGYSVTASGEYSTAMGRYTIASGENSTAIGYNTTASRAFSTATGYSVTASGEYSTAMGNNVSTNEKWGSFAIGDISNWSDVPLNDTNNQMAMRFAGGYKLYTSSDLSTGAYMNSGDNSWSTISDRRKKENFSAIDGEVFLKKIAQFNLTSWNYKGQDPKLHRHYGPMAQDFYAAFGNDGVGSIGNDTTINQADMEGVSFIAIQALVKRTEELQKENETMKRKMEMIENKNAFLSKENTELKAELSGRIEAIEAELKKGKMSLK
jgi:hypothetical protein